MKKCDWGWQGEAKKLRLRAEYLLMNIVNLPIPTDITLEFDKNGTVETMSAHKIFLAIGSEVFMAMFYGPAADTTQTNVLIPNYSKTVFEALVHYLYSDRIADSFIALEDDGLWMELLECAIQYGVPELATKCRMAIGDRLADDDADVCRILFEAKRLDETEIERLAVRALDKRPIESLSKLPDIGRDLLAEIVQRSELKISDNREIALYNEVRRLAIASKGREKNLPEPCSEACEHCIVKKDPVRHLGPVFQHIRFPLMSPSQLANGPIKDGIFTYAEIAQLFALKIAGNAPRQPPDAQFSSLPRQSRSAVDVGELFIQYQPYPANDWKQMFSVTVVPDWESCRSTSCRFLQLCDAGYEFALVAQSHSVVRHEKQAKFDVNPIDNIRNMFLPLPTTENSLMHDSGGTVSLCLAKNDSGEGSHYKLFISPGKEHTSAGTVFGRLADWDASLYLMKAAAYLKYTIARNLRVSPEIDSIGPY